MATVKVAAVQAAYVLMDQKACVAKAVDLLGRAAADGARLVVFPEVFIPGTPIWIDSGRSGTATRSGTRCWSTRPSSFPARSPTRSARPPATPASTW